MLRSKIRNSQIQRINIKNDLFEITVNSSLNTKKLGNPILESTCVFCGKVNTVNFENSIPIYKCNHYKHIVVKNNKEFIVFKGLCIDYFCYLNEREDV